MLPPRLVACRCSAVTVSMIFRRVIVHSQARKDPCSRVGWNLGRAFRTAAKTSCMHSAATSERNPLLRHQCRMSGPYKSTICPHAAESRRAARLSRLSRVAELVGSVMFERRFRLGIHLYVPILGSCFPAATVCPRILCRISRCEPACSMV